MSTAGLQLPLDALQPSQFLISAEKLAAVECWLDPEDLSDFAPLPVKDLDGRFVLTDGHTRAVAALRAGLFRVPLIPETDELDWEAYRRCVAACRARGVYSPADLTEKIVSQETYRREWGAWCARMQAELEEQRSNT